jgi:hypothetical protein
MAETKKQERTIKHLLFTYYEETEDPRTGNTVRVEREAAQGTTVELDPWDIERGERFGSFFTEEELKRREAAPEEEGGVEAVSLAELDTEEKRDWLKAEGEFEGEEVPTVNEVLDAVHAEPAEAEDVLEAENLATGNQPRKGVVEGLTKIAQDRDAG